MIRKCIFIICAIGMVAGLHAEKLKVLSWNIFMIPPAIYKSCQCERAELIADYIKEWNPDVIIFQEAFQKKPRMIIWEKLKTIYPHESGITKGGFLKVHSGVWIISKYPIERKQSITYKNAKGSDKFSKKGATLVEINVNGKKAQIIGTHVQSDAKYRDIRNLQFKQLIEELANLYFDPQVPQFIGGDLNTDLYALKDFADMISILDVLKVKQGGEKYSWNGKDNDVGKKFFGEHQETLDYIFLRTPHAEKASIKEETIYTAKVASPICKKKFMYMSDHYPVMADIILN